MLDNLGETSLSDSPISSNCSKIVSQCVFTGRAPLMMVIIDKSYLGAVMYFGLIVPAYSFGMLTCPYPRLSSLIFLYSILLAYNYSRLGPYSYYHPASFHPTVLRRLRLWNDYFCDIRSTSPSVRIHYAGDMHCHCRLLDLVLCA